jgi:hypothetical protein
MKMVMQKVGKCEGIGRKEEGARQANKYNFGKTMGKIFRPQYTYVVRSV